jgi:hypothetical protein
VRRDRSHVGFTGVHAIRAKVTAKPWHERVFAKRGHKASWRRVVSQRC